MNILFLTDNFPPEVNAPASRTYDHAKEWITEGHNVTVITCVPNFPKGKVYDGYKNKLCQIEWKDGIRIIRVWSYIAENKGFIKRTLDYISFSISSFIIGMFQKMDVIIATSPQFFTALSGRTLSFWRQTPWIMEVRDLWPESVKTVGVLKDNIFIKYFEWEEKKCYKSAAKIIVVTDSFAKVLIEKGVKKEKIFVIKNGVDRDLFKPTPKDMHLIKELGLINKKIIGYIGTHGMAHKLDFILNCAKNMQGKNNYHFLLIGSGAEKAKLLKIKEDNHINNVTMLDPVPKTEVSRYISILDLALVNLRKSPLFKTVIPSKIFENAAMHIPIIMGLEGESSEIIKKYNAGLCFEPENEQDFNQKLNYILGNYEFYKKCQAGCEALARDFDRKTLAHKMLHIITQL